MRIGLILPNSTYIHRLAAELRRCLEWGLREGGMRAVDIVAETTAYNASAHSVVEKTQALLLKDDVDVVVAPLGAALVADVEPLMRGQARPFIALTMGADTCVADTAPPWVFVNSFQLWDSWWLSGLWGGTEYGDRARLVIGQHEGGYGMGFAFGLGLEAADGRITASVPLDPDDDESDLVEQLGSVTTGDVDFVGILLRFYGAEKLAGTYDRWGGKSPLIGIPPLAFGRDHAVTVDAFPHVSIGSWNPASDASAAFVSRYVEEADRPAHAFALLAYEVGHLLADAASQPSDAVRSGDALCQALRSATFDGPRGPVAFDDETQVVGTSQHRFEITADGDHGRLRVCGPIDPPPLLAEQRALARRNLQKQGWTNPYLVA